MESIYSQTLRDWELIIVDDFSSDGAWEFFQKCQKSDSRISLFRGPRKGLYPGWNDAIRRARGEFIYIATSDDTMSADFLEKTVDALSVHRDCELAHAVIRPIDAEGNDINLHYYHSGAFMASSGDLCKFPHVRVAPFDGLMHLLGHTVYLSITQLLMRRSLFQHVGYFSDRWGPIGDFHWAMRATLVSNTIHVPDTWGSWRIHSSQATTERKSDDHQKRIQMMIDDAIQVSRGKLPGDLNTCIDRWADYFLVKHGWWNTGEGRLARLRLIVHDFLSGSLAARHYVAHKLGFGRMWEMNDIDLIRSICASVGIKETLIKCPKGNRDQSQDFIAERR
ncbi:putative glycosyltransferase EpsH [Stieleria varia]|uniref:Putative glycosyltransferase EpsH n=2 Tax=Stieleria varia TaxID=2528005 RepID=A0A5C6ANL0_9BACT|nr:putative glycosyltransferase EpsH [Stieleria varia]